MQIGSKVLVKGSYFSNIYNGEIIDEGFENGRPIWIVLIWFSQDTDLKPVTSNFFRNNLRHTFTYSSFYLENQ